MGRATTLASDLRNRREAAHLTQEQLARDARCSVRMIALLEAGYEPQRRSRVVEDIDEVLSAYERVAA